MQVIATGYFAGISETGLKEGSEQKNNLCDLDQSRLIRASLKMSYGSHHVAEIFH